MVTALAARTAREGDLAMIVERRVAVGAGQAGPLHVGRVVELDACEFACLPRYVEVTTDAHVLGQRGPEVDLGDRVR